MTDAPRESVFDLRRAASLLQQRAGLIVAAGALGFGIGAASVVVRPQQYVAVASFLPVVPQSAFSANDLVRTLSVSGFSGLNAGGGAGPEIYPDLLASTNLLGKALNLRPASYGGNEIQSYRSLFGFSDRDSARATAAAIKWLEERQTVGVNRLNGLVTVRFAFSDPALAASFLSTILTCINDFNRETRQSQAHSVRKFLEARITNARDELSVAENQLVGFRSGNLRFANAPRLAVEEERLERRVKLAEAVFQTLSQQYEFARIDEARDTPTITIVEPPVPPQTRAGPGLLKRGAIGAVIIIMLVGVWIVRPAWGTWSE